MVFLDPFDQIIYRGIVGRLALPVLASVDSNAVLSSQLDKLPPAWEFRPVGPVVAERRNNALEHLRSHNYMGAVDILRFYQSVPLHTVEDVIGGLPVDAGTLGFLVHWLGQMNDVRHIPGLPTGHEPSRVLADGILARCDTILGSIPYIRYVDDTWFFIDSQDLYDSVIGEYGQRLHALGLRLQPDKTRFYTADEAREVVTSDAIQYTESLIDHRSSKSRKVTVDLFRWALEDLPARKAEMRWALRRLSSMRDLAPIQALQEAPELLRYAPKHWVTYIGSLLSEKSARRTVGLDWLIGQAVQPSAPDDLYRNLLLLMALGRLQLSKDEGKSILGCASTLGATCTPIWCWAIYVWSASDAFKADHALEMLEYRGDYAGRRALASTLHRRRSDRKMETWLTRARLADAELEPTALWLKAA